MVYTLFEPFGERQHLKKYVDSAPTILFRAHSPRASGITSATYVASSAAVARQYRNEPYDDDILDMDAGIARDALERHVKTWNRKERDNFMSWTISPLFALQHMTRREATDTPSTTAKQVMLSILFTSNLPAGCFMPSVALLDAYGACYNNRMQRKYYHGEYLSQGRLDVPKDAMITITLEDLLASGLYQLYPDFALDKRGLCTRVAKLREMFLGQKHDMGLEEARLARTIAEKCCSEASFRYVLFFSLLGLKTRDVLDPGLQNVCSDLRHAWGSITEEAFVEAVESSQEVPEHSQFVQMISHFQEQERERTRQSKSKAGLELEEAITSALHELSISTSEAARTSKATVLSLNIHVARDFFELGPETPFMRLQPYPTMTRVYIPASEREEVSKHEAFHQITVYGIISGPCHGCTEKISPSCLRKGCFSWCTAHKRMVDQNDRCSGNIMQTERQCCYVQNFDKRVRA